LKVQIANVAGNLFRLDFEAGGFIHDDSEQNWEAMVHIHFNTMAEYAGVDLRVGLFLGNLSATVETGNGRAFMGVRVNGTTTQYHWIVRTVSGGTGDMALPSDAWFSLSSSRNSSNVRAEYAPDTATAWTNGATNFCDHYNSRLGLVFLVVAEDSSQSVVSTVIDAEVSEFYLLPTSDRGESAGDQSQYQRAWSLGQSPSANDTYWAPCVIAEDFSNYTNGLNVEPASTSVVDEWPEGLLQASGNFDVDGKFQAHYASETNRLDDIYMTVNSGGGYVEGGMYARTDNQSPTTWWQRFYFWRKGYGYDLPIPAGSVEFDWYYYRNKAYWYTNTLLIVQGLDSGSSVVWDVRCQRINDTTLGWYYDPGTGSTAFPTNPTFAVDFSSPTSYITRMQIYWDCYSQKLWFHTYRSGTGYRHYSGWFGLNYATDAYGAPMQSTNAVETVRIVPYFSATSIAIERHRFYYPALMPGRFNVHKGGMRDGYTRQYATSEVVPWRWTDNPVSGDPNYFDDGRYAQFAAQLNGGP